MMMDRKCRSAGAKVHPAQLLDKKPSGTTISKPVALAQLHNMY